MNKLILMAIALTLSACGGSSRTETNVPPPLPPVDPAPVADVFFNRVANVAGTAPEDADAADVGAVVGTEPENTEPTPI